MKLNLHYSRDLILFGVMISLLLMTGCSAIPVKQEGELPAQHSIDSIAGEDITYAIDIYDPWEGFNRSIYRFNAGFDHYIFLPVTSAYEAVMPDFAEKGISNFFDNLFEITNLANAVLQLKPKESIETVGRFLINTTIGLAGLFDVATEMGIYEHKEDFGQTLGHYGVGDGPYLVLPILGPSNLRDTTGNIVDSVAFTAVDPLNLGDHGDREITFNLQNAIDRRHRTGFRYYDTGSPFEYELVRLLYTKKRELDIAR